MPTKSHNKALRTAYFTALTGIEYDSVAVPVYGRQVPDNAPNLYISFFPVSNTDDSAKQEVTLVALMQVGIYTTGLKYANEDTVDAVTDQVLQRITSGVNVTGFQNFITELEGDRTNDWRDKGAYVAIDRILTFRHSIFQGIEQ